MEGNKLVTLAGVTDTLDNWVKEFNDIRRSFNGPDFIDYTVEEITMDHLQFEFDYSKWLGEEEQVTEYGKGEVEFNCICRMLIDSEGMYLQDFCEEE